MPDEASAAAEPKTAPAGSGQDAEPREWLFLLLNHVEGQVAFGDTKAGLLLTADSILLAGLATVIAGDKPMLPELNTVTQVLVGFAFIALCAGLIVALQAIIPSSWNLRAGEDKAPDAIVSFSRIAKMDRETFIGRALGAQRVELDRDIAGATHGKSRWATRKFWRLYVTVLCITSGIGAAFLAVAAEVIVQIAR